MIITWDERKRKANIERHGLDFADLERFDWNSAAYQMANDGRDGRKRLMAIGELDGRVISIVFAPWGAEAYSIISMRPASRKERRVKIWADLTTFLR